MSNSQDNQRTTKILTPRTMILPDIYLSTMVQSFLNAKKSERKRPGTIRFYKQKLEVFEKFCDYQLIKNLNQVNVTTIRDFMTYLEEDGHNAGGQHAFYRTCKAFLNWSAEEEDIDDWVNPFSSKRLKPPRVEEDILEPVNIDDVNTMLKTCGEDIPGLRDRAIIYLLLDTGIRASELINLKLEWVEWTDRSIEVRNTKNHQARAGFMCRRTKKALRAYLSKRRDDEPELFVTLYDPRKMAYDALYQTIKRRAEKAEVPNPTVHAFRRTFAITMLRKGVNVFQLQRLMGHSSLQVLMRYVKQMKEDLREAHALGSPVEELLKRR